jgi:hypothetical protein
MMPRPHRSLRFPRPGALFLAAVVGAAAFVPAAVLAKSDKVEKLIKDSSEKVRIKAALGLGKLKDKDGIPALAGALKDPVAAVRVAAASALGSIGDPAARPVLTAALRDADPDVRDGASKAIALLPIPGPPKVLKKKYFVEMGDVLNKTKFKDGAALVARYKEYVTSKLRGYGGDFFWDRASYPEGLTFGGAIKKVAKTVDGGLTQMEVSVSLVVTTSPGKKIVTIVDFEAAIGQEGGVSASEESSMAREALEAALDEAFKGFLTAAKKSE